MNQSAVAHLLEPEVTASTAATPVETDYSLTTAILMTASSTNDIQSQLLQVLLSEAGGGTSPAVDHNVNAFRIAPIALGRGLASLSLNARTNSMLQGLQHSLLPIIDRELHWSNFAFRFTIFPQGIENIIGTAISDAVRLQYLEQSLDPMHRARIPDNRETGIGVSFNKEWLILEESMGITRLQALTKAWDLLACSGSNDLTHEKFDAFEVYFRRLQFKLHTVTEDEAYA